MKYIVLILCLVALSLNQESNLETPILLGGYNDMSQNDIQEDQELMAIE